MVTAIDQVDARSRFNLVLTVAFIAILILFGGASRADVLSQPIVRIAAILLIVVAAAQLAGRDWRRMRVPLLFIGLLAAIMAVQLIPLPAGLWASLPGRSLYAESLATVGLGSVWRPISLTPDLTLNSLLALLPAAAMIVALATVQRPAHALLLPALLAGVMLSALLGLLQIASGGPYFYAITNEGSAVGLFANRNHQAALLACALPLLACWTAMPHQDRGYRKVRVWLALCCAAAIFPLLLITGSRAGIVLAGVGAVTALLVIHSGRRLRGEPGFSLRRPGVEMLPLGIGLVAVAATLFLARDVAIRRLIEGQDAEDRTQLLPVFIEMAKDFFPFGSGFGSFDPVYRAYEPFNTLDFTYLNHAHNDLAQLLIEGGAFTGLLLLAFLLWFAVTTFKLWTTKPRSSADVLGRTGSVVIFLLLLGSLVDYPLRTPFLSALLALACCWMLPRPATVADPAGAAEKQ